MKVENHIIDYDTITERQQATWATGDFNVFARQTMSLSETLCRTVNPRPGQRVLDLACGSGNSALVAARRYCEVTGIDYVPELIERAEMRAAAEGVNINFRVGDAQNLPFPDASFDVLLSVFGIMFAPNQERTASELLRVCRPGGTIGLVSHMPEGWGGDFFTVHAKYVPPPPGILPPLRWGTDAGLNELLSEGADTITSERRTFFSYFLSLDHAMELFLNYFGPTSRAFQMLDVSAQDSFQKELKAIFKRHNRATDGSLVVESPYLLTVATRA
jgi:ubiquinone/menaquinone biosynthesis C-methylase UbiE